MVDNFDIITPLLKFESEDDFYFLQILRRKKENELDTSNSRVIKNYYVGSIDYLNMRKEEIIELCKQFNARASIRLNKRSYRQVGMQLLGKTTNQILNDDYRSIRKAYDKVCGQFHNDKNNKKWILDIDSDDVDIEELKNIVNHCRPDGDKVIAEIPSKSGWHLITSPFNVFQFTNILPDLWDVEIHKDNPTNLYIS